MRQELTNSYGGLKTRDRVKFSAKRVEVLALAGDKRAAAVADAFVAHSKGESAQDVRGGPFVMIDQDSDAGALIANVIRDSELRTAKSITNKWTYILSSLQTLRPLSCL